MNKPIPKIKIDSRSALQRAQVAASANAADRFAKAAEITERQPSGLSPSVATPSVAPPGMVPHSTAAMAHNTAPALLQQRGNKEACQEACKEG
jgi:hypothetical protein